MVLANLENVGELFKEALKISNLTRLEVHGPEREVEKLRGPLAELKPQLLTIAGRLLTELKRQKSVALRRARTKVIATSRMRAQQRQSLRPFG